MYQSRTYTLEPWLQKKDQFNCYTVSVSKYCCQSQTQTVQMQTHTMSVQMNVSETEKLLINILRKTKMEQNNEI